MKTSIQLGSRHHENRILDMIIEKIFDTEISSQKKFFGLSGRILQVKKWGNENFWVLQGVEVNWGLDGQERSV